MSLTPDYPFATDGCSGGMTLLWRLCARCDPPWNDCCVEHDRAYWPGGTADARRQADAALYAAVHARGYRVWAWLIWGAVRVGGHPLLPTPWRWGYGWKYPRRYADGVPARGTKAC